MRRFFPFCLAVAIVLIGSSAVCSCFQISQQLGSIFKQPESIPSGIPECSLPPLCNSPYLTKKGKVLCFLFQNPYDFESAPYQLYARKRLEYVEYFFVVGQPAVKEIIQLVQQKISRPYEPMILHFAGDNGVGKTLMAQAISLALGQRCHPRARHSCEYGDSTLEFAGSSYVGYSLESFRADIVKKVVQHVMDFPIGVVVINEFSSLSREQASVLLPLLGRGTAFPEYPSVDLRGQLVILTTDLGSEGRTRGKKRSEIELLVHDEFRDLYSVLAASYMQSLAFLPVDLDVAEEIIRREIRFFGCVSGRRKRPAVEPSAQFLSFVLESVKRDLPSENGRCIYRKVVSILDYLFLELERQVDAEFVDTRKIATVGLSESGEVYLQIVGNSVRNEL